jgi:hypothetical protein
VTGEETVRIPLTILLSGTLVFSAGSLALGQASKEAHHTVIKDQETRVLYYYDFQNDGAFCRSTGFPALTIVVPPRNGTARVGETDATPAGCHNTIKANGVFYRPNPGFIGTDTLTVDKPVEGGHLQFGGDAVRNVVTLTVK